MTLGAWLHQATEILFLRIRHNLWCNIYNTKLSLWSFHQLKCLILVHWSLVNKLIYRSATATTYRRTQLLSKHLDGQDLPTLNLLGSFVTGICVISEWQAPLAPKPAPFFIAEFKVTALLLNTKINRKKTLLRTHPLLNPRNMAISHDKKKAVKDHPDTVYLSHVSIIHVLSRTKCMLL